MENATRALLMVAGVFFGLLIITMVLFMHNNISDYYESTETNKKTEQLATFNKEYSAYNRNDVRGSELLSLINKIIDFNDSKDIGEKEIEISIKIPKDSAGKYEYFYYKYSDKESETLIEINKEYTHQNIGNRSKGGFLPEANEIASKYGAKTEKLASNISKLIIDKSLSGTTKERAEKERQKFLEQLELDKSKLTEIKEDILKYYQYQQFKRAHFDCEELKFTKEGRVESFIFVFNGKFQ